MHDLIWTGTLDQWHTKILLLCVVCWARAAVVGLGTRTAIVGLIVGAAQIMWRNIHDSSTLIFGHAACFCRFFVLSPHFFVCSKSIQKFFGCYKHKKKWNQLPHWNGRTSMGIQSVSLLYLRMMRFFFVECEWTQRILLFSNVRLYLVKNKTVELFQWEFIKIFEDTSIDSTLAAKCSDASQNGVLLQCCPNSKCYDSMDLLFNEKYSKQRPERDTK